MRDAAVFIYNLSYADLDKRTVESAKRCLLDFIGAALGGANLKAGRAALRFVEHLPGRSEATVWSAGKKTSMLNAAFVNATMGSALDIDDGHRKAVGHPGGVVIPATLAVAEVTKASGTEFITALVCGYEVAIRAGNVYNLTHADVPGSARWASIGAAAAVAKLLHLPEDRIEQALAISSAFTPVAPLEIDLKKGFMPMTKFCSGWGAWVGICSALLAREGFTGVTSALDFSKSDLPPWGRSFEINNVYFKPYPSCRWTHPAIEGVLKLISEKNIDKNDIQKITIKTFAKAAQLASERPTTVESAQYSLPFVIALAVIDGMVTPAQMTEEKLINEAYLSFAKKVQVVHVPEFDSYFPTSLPTEVEVTVSSGEKYQVSISIPKGDPKNPLTTDELCAKFRMLARHSIDSTTAEQIIEKIFCIENVNNIQQFTNVFIKNKSNS